MSQTIGEAYINIMPSTENFKDGLNSSLDGLGNIVKNAGLAIGAGIGAASAGVGALTKEAVASYAEYEQLVGGVDTLFGESSAKVQEYAAQAFETAGLSANEYMETVTSFSASLLQSLDGDTNAAAESANQALTDMSDNANKMGTSMESIQNAYQGFAKQNYTMLDNLKLGYGGTKSEMERLLADASALSGVEYNIENLDDVYEAIHVIQGELGITGTTALEASTTISGSMNMLKASWANLLTGFANGEADIDALLNTVIDNLLTVIGNVEPIAEQALGSVGLIFEKLAPVMAEQLPLILNELLPGLLDTGYNVVSTIGQAILDNLPLMLESSGQIIWQIASGILASLPALLDTALQIITMLANGITSALPTIIPVVTGVVVQLVTTLVENAPMVLNAAIELISALAQGIVEAIPTLLETAPTLLNELCISLVDEIPQLISVALELMIGLGGGLISAIPSLLEHIPEIVGAIGGGLLEGLGDIFDVGVNFVEGLWNGIGSKTDWIISKIKGFGDDVLQGIKNFFGIASPSKVFRDEVGRWLPEGMAIGIEQNADAVGGAMDAIGNEALNSGMNMASNLANENYSLPRVNDGNSSQLVALLTQYLPLIANGQNVKVNIQGEMSSLFKAIQNENDIFKNQTGSSAFA